MSCCPASEVVKAGSQGNDHAGLSQWVEHLDGNRESIEFLLPTIHCGGCINKIETTLKKMDGVHKARVNLSTKRLSLEWDGQKQSASNFFEAISGLGYDARPFNSAAAASMSQDETGKKLLRAVAVAGFAAANVMLLSVSVWAGAEGTTRQLFHWISALIALPAIVYSGRPFFYSAVKALAHKGLNMDVPISLAVILAAGMSLFETIIGGPETYFDAAVTLLFFLLIGRYLDHMMREKARSAVSQLLTLNTVGATVVSDDGSHVYLPVDELTLGMTVLIAPGERVPVDGVIISGVSDVDRSIVTGEALPEKIQHGAKVEAGIVNLTGPLEIKVTAIGKDTFLGEVITLMETAEQGKARYMRIADRAASIYAPAVHGLAAITFFGWLWVTGGDWHSSLFIAIAVLIITCPCALGLAVPAVQIVANGILFKRGVLVKDGSALERMADIDTVIFDKTGTLTTGDFSVKVDRSVSSETKQVIAALARTSIHPLSKSIVKLFSSEPNAKITLDNIVEYPGMGIQADWLGKTVQLGSPRWITQQKSTSIEKQSRVVFAIDGKVKAAFLFEDSIRDGASSVISQLIQQGKNIIVLSGDSQSAVETLATRLGINNFFAQLSPKQKVQFVEKEIARGKKVLMVGDGINDAPALATATASLAPSSASDIGKTAADMVFTGSSLVSVLDVLDISRRATRHVHQNFGMAILYNLVAIPLAMFGFATPLFASIVMSSSSILVTSNALRLRLAPKSKISKTKNPVSTFKNEALETEELKKRVQV